jgi:hypothetical protein
VRETRRIPPSLDDYILLFHGTSQLGADSIHANGVSLDFSRERLDFGKGFYVTTSRRQAIDWAHQKALANRRYGDPHLVRFQVRRPRLAGLSSIWFVREADEDFWRLVNYCRRGGEAHGPAGWYDTVIGPVVRGIGRRQRVMPDSDQISFHTDKAVALINEASLEITRL